MNTNNDLKGFLPEYVHENSKKAYNWYLCITQSEPLVPANADSAHDEKCVEVIDFYYRLIDSLVDKLKFTATDSRKAGLQYASVERTYDRCIDNLETIRDNLCDFLDEAAAEREKEAYSGTNNGGITNVN